MGTDPEEGLIYYNRVMVGHRRPFNHLSLFCLQHRQWGVSCTQQILELVEKCKRGSWTNTKRLLKPLRRRFMGGQLRWRSLVFGNLIRTVCWSDRKFQTGDFCLWSCSVTAESDTTMFFKRHEYVSWVHSQSEQITGFERTFQNLKSWCLLSLARLLPMKANSRKPSDITWNFSKPPTSR